MISIMESLADYFDRTKSEKQRSLQRLGHRPTSQALLNSANSTAASTRTRDSQVRSLSIKERPSSAV